jgi:hypothetical protein
MLERVVIDAAATLPDGEIAADTLDLSTTMQFVVCSATVAM